MKNTNDVIAVIFDNNFVFKGSLHYLRNKLGVKNVFNWAKKNGFKCKVLVDSYRNR